MKKIIVFGATGTVGAYASLQLKDDGFEVVAVGSRASDNGFFASHGIEYISVDIRRKDAFSKLPGENVYGIVQLAAMLPARMKGYDPQVYIDINVTGMLNVLEYAAGVQAQRVLYSQSISDVANLVGTTVPIPEDTPSGFPKDNDHSVYAIAKNAASDLLRHYSARYGFSHYILRFPNIYLYHPNPYYYVDGVKRMEGYRQMIYMAMKSEPIAVWGNPSRVRDMVYVKDCTQLISLCMGVDNAPSGVYNVGTGVGTSMEDQIRGIVEVFSPKDHPSPILYAPEKPDSPQYIFDITKGRTLLGYRPRYGYIDYLKDFKEEMLSGRFSRLWGNENDYIL